MIMTFFSIKKPFEEPKGCKISSGMFEVTDNGNQRMVVDDSLLKCRK